MATKVLVLLLAIQVLAATHFANADGDDNGIERKKWFGAILAKVDTYFNNQDASTQSSGSLPCEFLNAYALPGGSIDVKKGSVDIRCEAGKQLNIDTPSAKCTFLGISPSKKSKRSARSNKRQKRDGNNNRFSDIEMRQLTARFGSKLPKCVDIPGYTGCYENTFDLDAVLNYMNFAYHPSSAADCVRFCGKNGFTLAGVYQHDEGSEEKDRCRCGTGQFPGNGKTSKDCDRPCLKDRSQICGGNKEFAVFKVGPYMAVYGPKTTPTTEQPTTRSTTEKLLTTTTPEPTTTSSTTTPEPTTTSTTTPEPTTTSTTTPEPTTTTTKTTTEKLVTPEPANVTNTAPPTTAPPKDVCVIGGKYYAKGATFNDGCDKNCICIDPPHVFRCIEKCYQWNKQFLPPGCRFVTVPNECCPGLVCENPPTVLG